MGLREKALDYSEETGTNLAFTPEDRKKEIRNNNDKLETISNVKEYYQDSEKELIENPNEIRKSEIFLNIIDLSKELSQIDTEKELFSTALLALMAHVGIKNIAFFIKNRKKFYLIDYKGYSNPIESHISVQDPKLIQLFKEKGILFFNEKESDLVKNFFPDSSFQVLIPIAKYEEITGFIIADSKISEAEYNSSDIIYLKLFGEIFGLFYSSLIERNKNEDSLQKYQLKNQEQESLLKYINDHSENRINVMIQSWQSRNISSAFLMHYNNFSGKEILLQSGLNINLKNRITNEIIWYNEIRKSKKWMHYPEYRDDSWFYENLEPNDWNRLENLYVLPLFYDDEWQGFTMLFSEKNLSVNELSHHEKFFKLLHQIHLTKELKNQNQNSFMRAKNDPFYAINSYILKKTEELDIYSVVFIQFLNSERLQNILNENEIISMRNNLESIIKDNIHPTFISRIGSDELLYLCTNADKKTSWKDVKTIQKELSIFYPDENFRPLIKSKIFSYPEDGKFNLSKLLFGI